MPGSRLLIASLLLGFIAACGENTEQVVTDEAGSPPSIVSAPGSFSASGIAQFGLIANITFNGNTAQFSDQAKVYVFLRESGTTMPLVVEQFGVSELPKQLVFVKDLQQSNIELVTRLSPDGKVNKSANDIEVITQVGRLEHPLKTFNISLGKGVTNIKLRLRVSANPALEVPRDAGLRIIVRGDDNSMPIITRSLGVGELPVELTFTDKDVLSLKRTLSSSKKLTISAQIYHAGTKTQSDSLWEHVSIEVDTENIPQLVRLQFGD